MQRFRVYDFKIGHLKEHLQINADALWIIKAVYGKSPILLNIYEKLRANQIHSTLNYSFVNIKAKSLKKSDKPERIFHLVNAILEIKKLLNGIPN